MDSSYEKYKRDMKAFVREMYSKNPAWLNSREGRKIQEVRRIKVDEAKDRLKLSLAERRTEIYELGLGEKKLSGSSANVSPEVKLEFDSTPELGWKPDLVNRLPLLPTDSVKGSELELTKEGDCDVRELVMGLDFGTSCTKVVIDDRQMQQRYAVPFVNSTGVEAYLLPARINIDGGNYSLGDNGDAFTDLKLSLMASPNDQDACSRVCAYLALVIRAARSWLFTEHGNALLNSRIFWTLALGQPVDQSVCSKGRELFEDLAKVAWSLAGSTQPISPKYALDCWRCRSGSRDAEDVEIVIMPELTAQIHGFVSSHAFDPREKNIYLMVDVGAGTVDASIFHVRKDKVGTFSFSFFTNSCEAYGAANLHRSRVDWWRAHLSEYPVALGLIDGLEVLRLPTEYRGRYPDKFSGYVKGVKACFIGGAKSPDQDFFELVLDQVRGRVMFKAKKENLLDQDAIKGLPFFLCGGGGRHIFYQKLGQALRHTPNTTWLHAEHRELTMPSDLLAPGVTRTDYDRLSVAYGLSRLNPGEIRQADSLQCVVPAEKHSDWRTHYLDK